MLNIMSIVCNLECAILLSKWLQTLSMLGPSGPPLSPEERSLLEMVRRMLDETEFAVPDDLSLPSAGSAGNVAEARESARGRDFGTGEKGEAIGIGGRGGGERGDFGGGGGNGNSSKMRQLCVAVLRLWAETFKGSSHIFDVVRVIGQGLERFADLLEKECQQHYHNDPCKTERDGNDG